MDELETIVLKFKIQWARIFTRAIVQQGKGRTKNVYVIPDMKNIMDDEAFITKTNVDFAIFQDLGTGKKNASGNPNKDRMYKMAKKQSDTRFGMPRARKFSKGNHGGIRASFYQTVPASLLNQYTKALTKLINQYTKQLEDTILP